MAMNGPIIHRSTTQLRNSIVCHQSSRAVRTVSCTVRHDTCQHSSCSMQRKSHERTRGFKQTWPVRNRIQHIMYEYDAKRQLSYVNLLSFRVQKSSLNALQGVNCVAGRAVALPAHDFTVMLCFLSPWFVVLQLAFVGAASATPEMKRPVRFQSAVTVDSAAADGTENGLRVGLQLHAQKLWRPPVTSHLSADGNTSTSPAMLRPVARAECSSSPAAEERAPWHADWNNSIALCAVMRDENVMDVAEWLTYYRCKPWPRAMRAMHVWGSQKTYAHGHTV
jgi:hypothetical protein